jgi:cell division protein FtsA
VGRKERYLVGLDVGTSKVTAVVAEILDSGLDVVGIGVAESRGIRRGVVVNLEAAVDSIKKAVEEAELMAGVEIDSVHLALSGPHVKGFNSRGVIAVAGKNREITREDVRRAIDAAKAVSLPTGREILHVLPQDFVVDEQDGIGARGNDRGTPRGERPHRDRQPELDAEHRRVREPRRRQRRRNRRRAAGGERFRPDG